MKRILSPEVKSARILSPLELNGIHIKESGVELTADEMAAIAAHSLRKGADG